MRPLDWERLLREHRVPFIDKGANVKRGELAIRCPFCGSADPSYHMGLNLTTGWWSCWRNRAQHSGKSPLRLLMKLLRVPYARAREIAGLGEDYVDPEGFDALAARLMGRQGAEEGRPEQLQRRRLHLDPDFIPIIAKGPTRRHWNYLRDEAPHGRGFSGCSGLGEDVDVLCQDYRLQACVEQRRGDGQYWGERILIPYYLDGELVTWTGRAIGQSRFRYLDLSRDASLLPPKETLFNHDVLLKGGKALVIVEGPFDALKLDFYGKPWGVRAVALSTNHPTDAQAYLLANAEGHFDRYIAMLDNATALGVVDTMRMVQQLYFLEGLETAKVPYGAKDAGELQPRQIIQWARAL